MKRVVVDLALFEKKEQVHAYLKEQLQFPAWYGANFDALHDCLTDLKEDAMIVLKNQAMPGRWGGVLRRVIADACEENKHLYLLCEEDENHENGN